MSCCSENQHERIDDKENSCCGSVEVSAASCCSDTTEEHHADCCGSEDDTIATEEGAPCCSNGNDTRDLAQETSCCDGGHDKPLVDHNEVASCGSNADQTTIEADESCCGNEANSCSSGTATPSCSGEQETMTPDHSIDYTAMEYRISGMDCPSCAATIEKGLEKLNDVIHAKVSYSTEKLHLTVLDHFSEEKIEKTILNLGFEMDSLEINKNEKTYIVEGMDCGSCAKTIENHLSNVSGVIDAEVSFSAGTMKVEHTNPVADIVKEVSKIGFQASLKESKQGEKPSNQLKTLQPIILSGLLIAAGFIGSYVNAPFSLNTTLFAIAMVLSGYKPAKSAYYAIKSRSLDMNVLMATAAIGAAIIGEWFEGATVVWLFSLGIYLQNRSMDQTRSSIRSLMNLTPSMAWMQTPEGLIQKPVEELVVGDLIVIKPGDQVPLDGYITEGETSINQAPITGESIPVGKEVGHSVYAGTVNESSSIKVSVTNLVEDTTLSRIIHLVEEAQEKKAPTEAFIDRFAAIYTPIVFALALVVIIMPPLLGIGHWGEWIYKGLALLVVACPCALVISTPVAIVSAIGSAARNGVLIKGGTFLETIGAVNAIAFDKTGTLTEGKPAVSDIHPVNGTEEQLLSIAFTLEDYATHPIAKTIVTHVKDRNIPSMQGEQFKTIAGKGVQATIDGEVYYAGSPKLFEEINLPLERAQQTIDHWQHEGKTIVLIGTKETLLGIIAVTDTIRSTTRQTMTMLKDKGLQQVVMLTGDNDGTAALISKEANVDRYFAELLPEDKVKAIQQLRQEGHQVAMVGDGINDAPALATSDLGVAMGGTGTDTAMETADIVLMADNLEKVPYTMQLGKKAMTIIKQNIWFSLIIKFVALVLIFPGWLTLWMAVLSDSGAAIIVILNSLRLVKKKKGEVKRLSTAEVKE